MNDGVNATPLPTVNTTGYIDHAAFLGTINPDTNKIPFFFSSRRRHTRYIGDWSSDVCSSDLAGQVAQFANGLGGYKARSQQSMQQQIGNPLRILHVGLAPGHVLDVLCIGHDQLERSFQNGVDRFPVHPGALHGHVRAAFPLQPLTQGQQLARGGAKGSNLFLHFPVRQHGQQASNHRRLVNIQTTTALNLQLHIASSSRRGLRCWSVTDTAMRPSRFPGATKSGTLIQRGPILRCGFESSQKAATSKPSLDTMTCNAERPALPSRPHPGTRKPFSCKVAGRRPMKSPLSMTWWVLRRSPHSLPPQDSARPQRRL